jgi:hypothetical protein
MITWAVIGSAVIALVLVVLVQGKWTSRDSWFAAVFAQRHGFMASTTTSIRSISVQAIFRRRRHQPRRPLAPVPRGQ